MRRIPLVLILVLAFGMAACSKQDPEVSLNDRVPAAQQVAEVPEGEGGGEAAPPADFASAQGVWVGDGLAYTSAPTEIPSGEVVLGLEVVGGLPHNVHFEGFEGDRVLVDGPGEGTFASGVNVPPGTYTYYCSIPGHRAAGMEGEVTAT